MRPIQSDASRHLLCPHCATRTRLNTLADGRRKCTVCGRKFRIHKATDGNKLQQCGEILLCFCLDFSPRRTAQITHHRYRLVAIYYDQFRTLIAEKTLLKEKIALLSAQTRDIHVLPNGTRCRWCKSMLRSADTNIPVFGVQLRESGEVTIDPLKDEEAVLHFHKFGADDEAAGRRVGYAGFICCGKFHRFTKEQSAKDGAAQLWTWIRERVRTHRGIWRKNTGYYLKELEWKYNNKALEPDAQAQKIIEFMPMDFLTAWFPKTQASRAVQSSAKAV